jgi:hypothetical protein
MGWVINEALRSLYSRVMNPVPISRQTGWATRMGWNNAENSRLHLVSIHGQTVNGILPNLWFMRRVGILRYSYFESHVMSIITHIIDIWIGLNFSRLLVPNCSKLLVPNSSRLLVPNQSVILRVQGFNTRGAKRPGVTLVYICRFVDV